MSTQLFDVLIIGTGISGLTSAIKLAENGANVAIITREHEPTNCNTYFAQGGIIYSKDEVSCLQEDISKASNQTSNPFASKILATRSADILNDILINKAKTNFTHDDNNNLKKTREAAHSKARIIYKGDYTGKEIEVSLINYVTDKKRFPNITLFAGHTAIDLLTPDHHGTTIQQRYEEAKVVGAYILNQQTGDVLTIVTKYTILATGGYAALYLHHSNSEGCRGDGHAMARRVGATLTNMEFIQFHPTTFYDQSSNRRFLISEAVRGEGAVLKNSLDEEFMINYHPDKELAPRDIVSRAIIDEIIRTDHACVYLDISNKDKDWIINRFPTIYSHCLKSNIDITKDPIPVVPSAHYSCGGIKTDTTGKTNVKNLYAVGEVSCTGLHGANRLASTALLEGLTWGYIAAEDILKTINNQEFYNHNMVKNWENIQGQQCDQALLKQDWLTIKQTMWNYVGLIRTTERLTRAYAIFGEMHSEIQRFYTNVSLDDELIGLRNAAEVAYMVTNASSQNKKSAGCFYRKN